MILTFLSILKSYMYTEVFESQNQAYKILLKHVFNKELITKGKKTEQHKNVL